MTTITAPMCMVCKHYDRTKDYMACAAFPEGIPPAITGNLADHRQPISGDMGKQFEQDPGKPPVSEMIEGIEFTVKPGDVKHTDAHRVAPEPMEVPDLFKAAESEAEKQKRILRELEAADADEPAPPDKPSQKSRDGYLIPLAATLGAALTRGSGPSGATGITATSAAESAFYRMHANAYRMGMVTLNPDHVWTAKDADAIARIVEGQMPYYQGFLEAVRGGELSDAQIAARADLYGEALWGSFSQGFVKGGNETGIDEWVWHTQDDDAVCELCAPREGEHYSTEDLPGFPGDGDFGDLCEGVCRCWLEPVGSGGEE